MINAVILGTGTGKRRIMGLLLQLFNKGTKFLEKLNTTPFITGFITIVQSYLCTTWVV